MKRLGMGMLAAASLALAAPSNAADLPLKAPPPAAPAYYNWNGFYIGAHGGYGWQDVDSQSFDSTGGCSAVARWLITAQEPPIVVLAVVQLAHGLTYGLTQIGTMGLLARHVPGVCR